MVERNMCNAVMVVPPGSRPYHVHIILRRDFFRCLPPAGRTEQAVQNTICIPPYNGARAITSIAFACPIPSHIPARCLHFVR